MTTCLFPRSPRGKATAAMGKEAMLDAAKSAGKSETLAQYAADYPKGPHDQPQSMCPAFGSLRVGLRMRARPPS
jgi:chlorophyllide a reductase subunit Y